MRMWALTLPRYLLSFINLRKNLAFMRFKWFLLVVLAASLWWLFLGERIETDTEIPVENGSVKVYFCPGDGCEDVLSNLLKNAGSIKCALYSLKLPNVTKVLQDKNADVLIDEDNYAGFGKEIVMSGLMHDKFCVLDDKTVWTGSFNPTYNGAYKENNNLVVVQSKLLAENYAVKFRDIKSGKKSKVLHPKLLLNGFLVENYFCPEDACESHVLRTLQSARSSIYFMTFSFTSDKIGDFLVNSHGRLEVRGVMEKSQLNDYTEFHKFNASNMSVRIDKNPSNMHHKVFIVDNETVITGSYNPTAGGNQKNRENILILQDSNLARQYVDEFEQVWSGSAD